MMHIHSTTHAHIYQMCIHRHIGLIYHIPKAILDELAPILEALKVGISTTCVRAALWADMHVDPQSSSRPCIGSHGRPQCMPAQWIQVCITIDATMVISETICVHQFVKYY